MYQAIAMLGGVEAMKAAMEQKKLANREGGRLASRQPISPYPHYTSNPSCSRTSSVDGPSLGTLVMGGLLFGAF